jgi:uncharacterized NAD-dependent epimerase/dehydratase family protein
MTAGLELYAYFQEKRANVGFIATGQIGITITGKGIPLDAYIVDHACGAVEQIVMEEADKKILIIEGQGSLLHPGSTATLPLMRGSCPTHLVLCHRADKKTLRSPSNISIPDLKEFIALNESLATVLGTFPKAKVIGVAVNTSKLSNKEAKEYVSQLSEELGLPVTDPVRYDMQIIGDYILKN